MTVESRKSEHDGVQRPDLAHWNDALYRHFFTVSPGEALLPLVRLYVTAEDLRAAANAPVGTSEEARTAFIESIRSALDSRSLGLDASLRRKSWNFDASAPPPFLSHLLLTCMVANDLAEELKSTGDFRERLSRTLGTQSQHGLDRLRPLWEDVAEWSSRRNLAGALCRRLQLPLIPDSGYHSIIGYSVRLAVPSRRDQAALASLLSRHDLVCPEPELNAVLRVVSANLGRFSSQFADVFREFASALKSLPAALLFHSTFWTAVREVALSGLSTAVKTSGSARTRLELEDDDGRFWFAITCDKELSDRDARAIPLPTFRQSPFQFVLTESEGDSLFGRALSSNRSSASIERLLAGTRTAVADGLLLFEENDDDVFVLSTSFPSGGRVRALVSDRLRSAFKRALESAGVRPEITNSAHDGWSEWRGLTVEGLRGSDFSRFPSLLSVKSLRLTLPPPEIRLRGGIRSGNSFVALTDAMPVVEAPGAEIVTIELDSQTRTALEKVSDEPDTWCFGADFPIGRLHGTRRIVALAAAVSVAEREVTFVENTFDVEYKRPSDPSRWLVEAGQMDMAILSEQSVSVTAPQEDWKLERSRETSVTRISVAPVSPRSTDPLHKLTTILSSQFAAQRGIPEGLLLPLMTSALALEVHRVWPVLRAWVEAGILDVLTDARWRSRTYFARTPRLVAYRRGIRYEAVLTGLAPPFLLERFDRLAARFHLTRADASSVSPAVPLLARCHSRRLDLLTEFAKELGLPELEWLRTPRAIAASVRSVTERHLTEPQNWPLYREWDWNRRIFSETPTRTTCSGISIRWCRRDDGPDCYKIWRDGSLVWWSRSRTWAVIAAFTLAGLPVFEIESGGVIQSRGDSLYLPLPLARIVALIGPVPPAPVQLPDSTTLYRYTFPDDVSRDSVLEILWPSSLARTRIVGHEILRKLVAIARTGTGPVIPVPFRLRRALEELSKPESILRLDFVPASALPRLYAFVTSTNKGDVAWP